MEPVPRTRTCRRIQIEQGRRTGHEMYSTKNQTISIVKVCQQPSLDAGVLAKREADRIALLVWLITHTPQPEISNPRRPGNEKMLTAKDLKDAIEERRNDIATEKWEIIEEIIRVRTKEEALLRDEISKSSAHVNKMPIFTSPR